jgi:hypothetical protein
MLRNAVVHYTRFITLSPSSSSLLTRTMGVPTSHMADFMTGHHTRKYTITELRADVGL